MSNDIMLSRVLSILPIEDYQNTLEDPQILTLPEEILKLILSYVDEPSRRNASLVCHIFYVLICELERDRNPLDLCYSQICDDNLYDSMINSQRQFCDLTIDLKSCRLLSSSSRIESIVRKFGQRIKIFKFWCSVQRDIAEVSDSHIITILQLIPKVEELELYNIYVNSNINSSQDELDLHRLKKLVLNYCHFDTSLLLDIIPANVLHELVFTFESSNETCFQNFFNRQTRIKKLEMFENDQIKFDHLQLEHLKISSSIDFTIMLSQQSKLRYIDFAISWIDDDVFAAVVKLTHLEVLRTLIDQVSCREFKRLNELKQLKELRLDSHSSFDCGHLLLFSMMKYMQLEKLTLLYMDRKIPEEILVQISRNFCKIRHIELINRSIKVISTIVENFPNLESILFDFFAMFSAPEDVLEINEGFNHKNLKQLVVINVNTTDIQNSKALLKLVNACLNLEKIMLSKITDVSLKDFVQLMESHPKLTHLSLEIEDFQFDLDTILVISKLTTNLIHFRLSRLYNYPMYSTIRKLFEDSFATITLYKYSTGEGELVMKRRRVQDWYLQFNLRDHF